MRLIIRILVVIGCLWLGGCSSIPHIYNPQDPVLWISPNFSRQPQTYIILPFDDYNALPEKFSLANITHPEAADVVREAFENAFITTANRVLEWSRVQQLLSTQQLTAADLKSDQGGNLWRLIYADICIFGTVTSFFEEKELTRATIGFSVRAVDIQTGVVLWKGSHFVQCGFGQCQDLRTLADEVAQAFVQAFRTETPEMPLAPSQPAEITP